MTKILLADDHCIIRSALKTIIEREVKGTAVDEACDGNTVINKIQQSNYDLMILDINMPGPSSVDLLARIFSINPKALILVFSMNPKVPFEKIYLQLGTKGYLAKTDSQEEIIKAIHTVLAGNIYQQDIPRNINDPIGNPFDELSPREFEVMQHLLEGETVKEIYRQSGLAISTVSTYKARIFEKLGIKNVLELVSLAKMHHIIND